MGLSAAHHTFLVRTGDFHAAAAVAEQNEAVAKKTADPMAMMMADWMLGVSHHLLSGQASARKLCETWLKPRPIQKPIMIRSGYDQRIRAQLTLARALWLEGYASRAVTVATQALDQATVLDHPVSMCVCGIYRVTLLVWTGDWSGANGIVDSLIAYAEKYSLRCHHAISLGLKGELSLRQGDAEAALRLLSPCLNALEAVQHQTMTPVFASDLAICLARAGRPDEADAAIDKAMGSGGPTRPHFYLPEIMRIKGELLASGPHSSEAESWFSRSLDLGREQSAVAWGLRTPTSLARLLARQGRSHQPPRLLLPAYSPFPHRLQPSAFMRPTRP